MKSKSKLIQAINQSHRQSLANSTENSPSTQTQMNEGDEWPNDGESFVFFFSIRFCIALFEGGNLFDSKLKPIPWYRIQWALGSLPASGVFDFLVLFNCIVCRFRIIHIDFPCAVFIVC